jgi:dipeptidyl aminopeptidase/acylaminoacyl peptidase
MAQAVSLAGVVDLQHSFDLHLSHDAVVEFLGGKPAEVPDHYREADPLRLAIPRAIQVLIHGSADEDVPAEFSRHYFQEKKKTGENVSLIEIPKAEHLHLIDPRSVAWTKVEGAVQELLKHRL